MSVVLALYPLEEEHATWRVHGCVFGLIGWYMIVPVAGRLHWICKLWTARSFRLYH